MRSRVISYSMSPLISKDDIITAKRCSPLNIKIGDIVLFKLEKILKYSIAGEEKEVRYMVHRIVDKKIINGKKILIHKGDASYSGAPLDYERVFGKIIHIEKKTYRIALNTFPGKVINAIFGIISIVEYRLFNIASVILRYMPIRGKHKFVGRIFHLFLVQKRIILRIYFYFLKSFGGVVRY